MGAVIDAGAMTLHLLLLHWLARGCKACCNSLVFWLVTYFGEEIQNMISDVDVDGCGTFGFEGFLKMTTHMTLNRDPNEEILKAFRL